MAQTALDVFKHELGDLYDAEHRFVEVIETMEQDTADRPLAHELRVHHESSLEHIRRLERVFDMVLERPHRTACAGATGLAEEYRRFEAARERPDRDLMSMFVAATGLKAEHYEIAAYESLVTLAQVAGLREAAELLKETLTEEQEMADRLEAIAAHIGSRIRGADDAGAMGEDTGSIAQARDMVALRNEAEPQLAGRARRTAATKKRKKPVPAKAKTSAKPKARTAARAGTTARKRAGAPKKTRTRSGRA